jgi:DNA-binding IclR family transcriptional regulator
MKARPPDQTNDISFEADEYGNRSTVLAFAILKALIAEGRSATLRDLAKAVHLTPSRTHRFLAGLIKVGVVTQNRESGKYDLGPGLIELGMNALRRVDVIKLGIEATEQLAMETGMVSILCIWGGDGPTVIKWAQGKTITAFHIREGVGLPLLTTATGKIFLAFLPGHQTEKIVADQIQSLSAAGATVKLTEIDRMKATVRRKGIASSHGKTYPEFTAISCPVFDHNGGIKLALTLMGDASVEQVDEDGALAGALKAAARELSHKIGYIENADKYRLAGLSQESV